MTVKKQAAVYLLSIDPETERLQVEKTDLLLTRGVSMFLLSNVKKYYF